jgi:hypothetical protein
MTIVVGGIFANITQAEQALEDFLQHGFHRHDLSLFHVNSPGQHDTYPVGGDQDADPQARDSHKDATKGAAAGAAIGLAAAAAGPAGLAAAAAAAAAVGAYTGALSGVLGGLNDAHTTPQRRGGVMLAVNAGEDDRKQRAFQLLKQHGALDIEWAEGTWGDGQWLDFDPVAVPNRFEAAANEPPKDEKRKQ